jgi:hypothetical protein
MAYCFYQGIGPPGRRLENKPQADALLAYAYDKRDVIVGEWFISERRTRLLARALDFATKEALQARQRLEHVWTGVNKIRHIVIDSGITDAHILQGRDLAQGPSEHPPGELAYVYFNKSNSKLSFFN